MASLSIRTMTREELDIAVDWAAVEGWNPRLADANCFYAADPHGFLIEHVGVEPVATISVVKYGTRWRHNVRAGTAATNAKMAQAIVRRR